MPANPNHARHHVSIPPPPNLGLAASHEGQGSRQPRASEDRRTSKRSHLRCGVLEGAASLAHPRAARMCGQAGPETTWHVMFAIPACLNSLTGKDVCWWDGWDRRVGRGKDEQRRRKRSSRVMDRQGGTWTCSEEAGWGMGYRWKGNEGQDGWRARTGRQRRGGDCGDPEQSLASTGVSVSQTSHVDHAPMRQAEPGRGPTRGGQSLRGPQRWDGNGALGLTHLHKG